MGGGVLASLALLVNAWFELSRDVGTAGTSVVVGEAGQAREAGLFFGGDVPYGFSTQPRLLPSSPHPLSLLALSLSLMRARPVVRIVAQARVLADGRLVDGRAAELLGKKGEEGERSVSARG